VCDSVAGQKWPTPRLFRALSYRGITQLALASPRCGLLSSGHVLCWGTYIPQVLGTGSVDVSSDQGCSWNACGPAGGNFALSPCAEPTEVPIDRVTGISTGKEHVCALRNDGTVWCWGWNTILQSYPDVQWTAAFMAQHGGSEPDFIGPPRQVPLVSGAVDVQSSTGSCARFGDGTAACWGGDIPPGPPGVEEGNGIHLGDYDLPVRTVPLDNVAQVTLGDYAAFALRGDGAVYEFGFGPGRTPIEPLAILDLAGASRLFATPWDDIVASSGVRNGQYLAALFRDGTVRVRNVAISEVVHDQSGAALISADGGYVTSQEKFASAVPVGKLVGVAGVSMVAAAEQVLCVVIGTDEVLCVGNNAFGQLGRGTVGFASQEVAPVIWPPEVGATQ